MEEITQYKAIIGMSGQVILGILFGLFGAFLVTLQDRLFIQQWQITLSFVLSIFAFCMAATYYCIRSISIHYVLSFIIYLCIEIMLIIMLSYKKVLGEFIIASVFIVIITVLMLILTTIKSAALFCIICCAEHENYYEINNNYADQIQNSNGSSINVTD